MFLLRVLLCLVCISDKLSLASVCAVWLVVYGNTKFLYRVCCFVGLTMASPCRLQDSLRCPSSHHITGRRCVVSTLLCNHVNEITRVHLFVIWAKWRCILLKSDSSYLEMVTSKGIIDALIRNEYFTRSNMTCSFSSTLLKGS